MEDLDTAWDELSKLPRNDLPAALAWRARWLEALDLDDGLGEALLRLFDNPLALLAALPAS
jgi:hypothetical protein